MDEFGNTIHVIDGVLEAQFLLSEARFTRERSTHWEVSGEANISTALGWAADSDSYAVVVGGLLTLSSWTLFLPSNDALAALPTEWRTKLQSDVSLFYLVLSRLSILDVYPAERLKTNRTGLLTYDTTSLMDIIYADGNTFISLDGETARVVGSDNLAARGVVHAIDKVLFPESIFSLLNGES